MMKESRLFLNKIALKDLSVDKHIDCQVYKLFTLSRISHYPFISVYLISPIYNHVINSVFAQEMFKTK